METAMRYVRNIFENDPPKKMVYTNVGIENLALSVL